MLAGLPLLPLGAPFVKFLLFFWLKEGFHEVIFGPELRLELVNGVSRYFPDSLVLSYFRGDTLVR